MSHWFLLICVFSLSSLYLLSNNYLDDNAAISVVTALVSSRLDYVNSILFGCPLKYRSRLRRVQNALARVTVPQNSSFPTRSTTALLRHLHWLPIDSRISFKLSTITFKALGSGRPRYLANLLHKYIPHRTIRSSSAKQLTVPRHNQGLRAFRISAPTPPGTRSHRISVIVHHLLVLGTTSKHIILILFSSPSDT